MCFNASLKSEINSSRDCVEMNTTTMEKGDFRDYYDVTVEHHQYHIVKS